MRPTLFVVGTLFSTIAVTAQPQAPPTQTIPATQHTPGPRTPVLSDLDTSAVRISLAEGEKRIENVRVR